MFNNLRVRSLESELQYEKEQRYKIENEINLLRRDLELLMDFLGANFVTVNKRVIEKKEGGWRWITGKETGAN